MLPTALLCSNWTWPHNTMFSLVTCRMSHRERNQSPRSDQMQRVWLQDHVQEENKEMYPFDFVCMKTTCENIKNDQLTCLFQMWVFLLKSVQIFWFWLIFYELVATFAVDFLDSLISVVVFDARWRRGEEQFWLCLLFVVWDHVNK